jgi:hypothetical protein
MSAQARAGMPLVTLGDIATSAGCSTFVSRMPNLKFGAEGRARTADACAFNAALYQLSYLG